MTHSGGALGTIWRWTVCYYSLCRFIPTPTEASARDGSSGEPVSSCLGTSPASSTINTDTKHAFGFSAPALSFLHVPFISQQPICSRKCLSGFLLLTRLNSDFLCLLSLFASGVPGSGFYTPVFTFHFLSVTGFPFPELRAMGDFFGFCCSDQR